MEDGRGEGELVGGAASSTPVDRESKGNAGASRGSPMTLFRGSMGLKTVPSKSKLLGLFTSCRLDWAGDGAMMRQRGRREGEGKGDDSAL